MKMRNKHTVPLSKQTIALLEELKLVYAHTAFKIISENAPEKIDFDSSLSHTGFYESQKCDEKGVCIYDIANEFKDFFKDNAKTLQLMRNKVDVLKVKRSIKK